MLTDNYGNVTLFCCVFQISMENGENVIFNTVKVIIMELSVKTRNKKHRFCQNITGPSSLYNVF
jgi:hypothetical protein